MRLKRYFNKEVLLASAAVLFILLLIFASQQFVRYLSEVVNGKIAPDLLLGMVALQLPPLIGFLLPLSLFLGILLAFGQLYVDNELTVARSLGIGNRQLASMLAPLAVAGFSVSALFSIWIAPWSAETQQDLLSQQEQQSELTFLTPGKFQVSSDGSRVLYAAERSEKGEFTELFYARMPDERRQSWHIVSAKSATLIQQESSSGILSLVNGESYQMPLNNGAWSISQFQKYHMSIQAKESQRKLKLRAVPTWQLLSSLSTQYWAELHWRLAIPISSLILVFLAIPIARVEPRQGKFARMLPGLLLYLSYMIFLMLGRGLIEDGKIPGSVGLWWVHGLFAALAIWQYSNPHASKRNKSRLGFGK